MSDIRSVCIHVERGELDSIVEVTIAPAPMFVPLGEARAVKVCALCYGWFSAVTRFGLPVRR